MINFLKNDGSKAKKYSLMKYIVQFYMFYIA